MTYSFIKPKIKPIFSLFTKIWIVFFIVGISIILSIYFFVLVKYLFLNSELQNKKQEAVLLQEKTKNNETRFKVLTQRKELALEIVTVNNEKDGISDDGSNEKTKKVVNNLFDFIIKSQAIKLEHMLLTKTSLELKGVTPTKEMFSLLVQTPLKSIFDQSQTNFYMLNNGWFKFVNINRNLNLGGLDEN